MSLSAPHSRKANRRACAGAERTGEAGKSSRDLDTSAQLRKRARRKYLTTAVSTNLAEYAKTVEDPAALGQLWERSYRNSVYCALELKQEDGKVTGRYCGNRWCLVCSAIRTARTWERHGPIIDGWKRPQFVTVTRRNVPAAELQREIASMLADLVKIKDRMRKRDHVALVALRKLECTYNADTNTYHPHFHLIVETRMMARLFVADWMDIAGDIELDPINGRASWDAQKIKPADRAALAELLKYFTKLVAKTKMMPAAALHEIFRAMRGRRVYQNVGYTLEKDDDESEEIELEESTPALTRRAEVVVWEWSQSLNDWIDLDTGECLTGYEPATKFRAFVAAIVRAELSEALR